MYGDDYYDDDEYFSDLTWAEGGFEVAPLGSKKKKKKRTSDDEDYDELDYELKEFQDFSKKKVSKAKEIEKKLSAQANEFLKNAGFNSKGLNPEQLQKDSDEQVDELLQTMNEELKKQADSKKEEEQLRKKCVAMAKKAKENAKKLDVNTTVNNTATVFQIKDIDSGEGNAVTVHFEHPYGRNYQSKSEWKEKRKEHAKKGEYMTPQQFEKWLNTPLKFNNPEEYIRKMQENLKKESEAEAKRIAERYTAPLTKREIFEREKAKGKESLSRYLQDRVAKQLADLIMAGFYKDTDYDVSDLDTEKQQKKTAEKVVKDIVDHIQPDLDYLENGIVRLYNAEKTQRIKLSNLKTPTENKKMIDNFEKQILDKTKGIDKLIKDTEKKLNSHLKKAIATYMPLPNKQIKRETLEKRGNKKSSKAKIWFNTAKEIRDGYDAIFYGTLEKVNFYYITRKINYDAKLLEYSACKLAALFFLILVSNTPIDEEYDAVQTYTERKIDRKKMPDSLEEIEEYAKKRKNYKKTTVTKKWHHTPDDDIARGDWILHFHNEKIKAFHTKNDGRGGETAYFNEDDFVTLNDQAVTKLANKLYELTDGKTSNFVGFNVENVNDHIKWIEGGGWKKTSGPWIGHSKYGFEHGLSEGFTWQAPRGFIRIAIALYNSVANTYCGSAQKVLENTDLLNFNAKDAKSMDTLIKQLGLPTDRSLTGNDVRGIK